MPTCGWPGCRSRPVPGRRHRERRQPRQGVALAAARFGTRATVWMPAGAPETKVATRSSGPGSSWSTGRSRPSSTGRAEAAERGLTWVHVRRPRRDRRTGDGRARAGPPASRAGHGRGARRWWRAAGRRGRGPRSRPPARTHASSGSRRPVPRPSPRPWTRCAVTLDRVATMADGIAVARPGELPLAMAATLVDGMVTVTDEELWRAMHYNTARAAPGRRAGGCRRGGGARPPGRRARPGRRPGLRRQHRPPARRPPDGRGLMPAARPAGRVACPWPGSASGPCVTATARSDPGRGGLAGRGGPALAVLGPNGAGKSTLLRLAGAVRPRAADMSSCSGSWSAGPICGRCGPGSGWSTPRRPSPCRRGWRPRRRADGGDRDGAAALGPLRPGRAAPRRGLLDLVGCAHLAGRPLGRCSIGSAAARPGGQGADGRAGAAAAGRAGRRARPLPARRRCGRHDRAGGREAQLTTVTVTTTSRSFRPRSPTPCCCEQAARSWPHPWRSPSPPSTCRAVSASRSRSARSAGAGWPGPRPLALGTGGYFGLAPGLGPEPCPERAASTRSLMRLRATSAALAAQAGWKWSDA